MAVSVIDKSGADWGIVFDSINIAESTAKTKLGVWTVALSIDGQVEVETEFQIISYSKFNGTKIICQNSYFLVV